MAPIYYRTIRNLRCPPLPATGHVSDTEEEEEEEEEDELSEAERDRQIVESLRKFDIRAQGWSTALLRSEMSVVTPLQPRPSQVKTGQLPYIPPEIQSKILSHLVVQDGPILLRPKHSIDSKYLDGSSHDSPGRSGDSDDGSNKQPPTLVHTVPTMDLLLLNRFYHEECTRHFYSENSLMILGRTHLDDILQLLDDRERAFVRHVTLEALVEIDSRLWISGSQRWMFMTVRGIWGHVGVSRLCLCPKEEAIFPNLQSITVRVRYRKKKRTGLVVPFVSDRSPEGSLTMQEYNNIWDRRGMEAVNEEQIAFYLAEMFECIGRGDWIPMYHLAFLPSEDRVWDDLAPTRPLSTFERVIDGSYKITAN